MNRAIVTFLLTLLVSSTTSAEETPPPPCSEPEHRQFDFWLGKWTAYSEDGQKQGTNHLTQVMGQCVMQENWQSASGFSGTSFNFYDANRKVWHQTWVDNSGGKLLLEGGLRDGKMQLQGDRINGEGKTVTDRITWTPLPDGRVRQHWQATLDGENWQDVFDGYYQRDKE